MRLFTSACIVLALASAPTPSFASSEPKISKGQRWYGTYTCGQSAIAATLEVIDLSNTDSEQIEVQARLSLSGLAEASYGLKGTLRRATDTLSLAPLSPSGIGIQPVAISGNISADGTNFEGAVTHPRCTTLALRAGAIGPLPRVFGILLGSRMEVPVCQAEVRSERRCTPSGLSCWQEQKRTENRDATCQSSSDSRIYFAASDQPGWVDGGLQPIMLGRELVGFEFKVTGKDAAREALTKRLGPPINSTAVTRSRDALATCTNGQCVITPASSWIEYRDTWEREGLVATLFEGVVNVRTSGSVMRQQATGERKRAEDQTKQRSGRTF